VKVCREAGDDASRAMFEKMIEDEERHTDFLEGQLHAIKELGYEIYLSQQMTGGA
jgi:bacterioferritin